MREKIKEKYKRIKDKFFILYLDKNTLGQYLMVRIAKIAKLETFFKS